MKKTATILGAAALAAAVAGPTASASTGEPSRTTADRQIPYQSVVKLQSNALQTYRLPIEALGQGANVLLPCWGFSITGSGVDLAVGQPQYFGPTDPEPGQEQRPDGGVPGAVRDADGTLVLPESRATITPDRIRRGANCRAVGWRFYDDQGNPTLDPYGNPWPSSGKARTAKASRSLRAKQRRRAAKKVKGRAAQSGPVTVELAGLTRARGRSVDMVIRVRTGRLSGPTTLSMHARLIRQEAPKDSAAR